MAIQQNTKFKIGVNRTGIIITGGIFSLVGITALTGAILANTTGGVYTGINKTSAVTISDNETITAAVQVVDSCTIGKTSENTTDAVTIPTGTYNNNVKNTTMKVICNDPSGFDVYAVGYGGDKEGTTAMINKNDASYTIPTGTATSGNTSNWAMKVEAVSGTYAPTILNDFDAGFQEVPDEQKKVAAYESVVDSSVGSSFTATYAAYVTYDQQAGTYEGKVMYLLSHPSTTTFNEGYMQDFTASMCSEKASDKAVIVVDIRDGQEYTVRHINGSCWMTRNLAIGCDGVGADYGSNIVSVPLTSSDSNVASAWSTPTRDLSTNTSDAYSPAMMACNATYGGYYNFCATAAGNSAACSSNSTYSGSNDICPKNWRLPTRSEQSSVFGYITEFNPVYSGGYRGGTLNVTSDSSNPAGLWFSSTAESASRQYYMRYSDGSLAASMADKLAGYPIRCVAKS